MYRCSSPNFRVTVPSKPDISVQPGSVPGQRLCRPNDLQASRAPSCHGSLYPRITVKRQARRIASTLRADLGMCRSRAPKGKAAGALRDHLR